MNPEDIAILKSGGEALERSLAIFETWLEDGHNDGALYQATRSMHSALQQVCKSCPDLLSADARERVAEMNRKAEAAPSKSRFNTGF